MTAHPQPSDFEARTNAAFEALMWAMARPGLPRRLPEPGAGCLVEALIDRECQVFCDDDALAGPVARTGARASAPEEADHVFLAAPPDAAMLRRIAVGSDLYPDEGATLVLPITLGEGPALTLSGPGIEGRLAVRMGLPGAFWAVRHAVSRYPMGFELVLVDGDKVVGVPRSTRVEVD